MAEEKELTSAERLEWLRSRGIAIETPEERKAKAIRDIMNEHDDVLVGLPGEDQRDFSVGLVEEQQNRFQGIDASTNGKVKQEAGYAWTQTEEDLEVTIGLPAHDVSAKEIKVIFQSRHVSVRCRGQLTLELSLFEAIDVDGSTWTLDSNSETANLVLVMDKVEHALWSRIRN